MDLSELIFTEIGEHSVDIELFDCGRDDINDFFRNDAATYQDELFGKTYFFCLPDNPSKVVAAFTFPPSSRCWNTGIGIQTKTVSSQRD